MSISIIHVQRRTRDNHFGLLTVRGTSIKDLEIGTAQVHRGQDQASAHAELDALVLTLKTPVLDLLLEDILVIVTRNHFDCVSGEE
jgi:hypothetical protein